MLEMEPELIVRIKWLLLDFAELIKKLIVIKETMPVSDAVLAKIEK